ncbi:MAG TPA: SRPBCC family protein [Polyangiaceae bacterium]|nr:SRPBCC family protein [Polyangiaceae bacterium]
MSTNSTTLERTSDRELIITRTFRASASAVFQAWTEPEYVKRWWAPRSRGVSVAECTARVEPGGNYRYVLALPNGEQIAFSGKYIEIQAPTRLVYTQRFEAVPAGEALLTVLFEEQSGLTRMVSREVYPSKEALEMALTSGMEDGMRETFDQLDMLLSSAASAPAA